MIERHEKKQGARILTPDLATDPENKLHTGTHKCECCGNEYDKPLEVVQNGISHYFDCFECAIHVLAPTCAHCGVRIVGHGHEASGEMYCCAHCATHEGVTTLKDRAN